jgi:ubiquinol-cytochrome c reductase cytochrome c1 subunit
MKKLALAALGLLLLAAPAVITPAFAQEDTPEPPQQNWSFSGIFGTYNRAALQRGFQVYEEVCSNCHSMKQLSYRNLQGIGLTADQVRAIASNVQVQGGEDTSGQPVMRAALPSDHFRSPFPNDAAARSANNGALPPDQSVLEKAREGGANYIYGILVGYAQPPAGMHMAEGMNYNKYFPGHQIAMPQPLHDGQVTYADGTTASVEQMARDVTTFLTWAANPEMEERKRMGVKIILFLVFMTALAYAVKRKVWADAH